MSSRIRFSTKDARHLSLVDLRRAFVSWLISRKLRGTLLFRIDNVMDKEPIAPNGKIAALSDLTWLGIGPDESFFNPDPTYAPYVQNERGDIYRRYIDTLLSLGVAYRKIPPKEKGTTIADLRSAIYLKAANNVEFVDLLLGKISPEKFHLGDWIIVHQNGLPSVEFATIIDDHLMNITHVVSEERLLMNAIKCHSLCHYLHWSTPTFIHLPDIKETTDEKSHRLTSLLRTEGFLPEAVSSYLYNLEVRGHEQGHLEKIDDMVADFEIRKIHQEKRVFDLTTLGKINAAFIKKTTDAEYAAFIRPFVQSFIGDHYGDEYLLKLATLYKKQITYGAQLRDYFVPFLAEKSDFSPVELSLINAPESRIVIKALKEEVEKKEFFGTVVDNLNAIQKKTGINGKAFYLPIRLLLTRLSHGAEIDETINFLGKEEVLRRLSQDKD